MLEACEADEGLPALAVGEGSAEKRKGLATTIGSPKREKGDGGRWKVVVCLEVYVLECVCLKMKEFKNVDVGG